jgi:hypothetical protein
LGVDGKGAGAGWGGVRGPGGGGACGVDGTLLCCTTKEPAQRFVLSLVPSSPHPPRSYVRHPPSWACLPSCGRCTGAGPFPTLTTTITTPPPSAPFLSVASTCSLIPHLRCRLGRPAFFPSCQSRASHPPPTPTPHPTLCAPTCRSLARSAVGWPGSPEFTRCRLACLLQLESLLLQLGMAPEGVLTGVCVCLFVTLKPRGPG